MKSETFAVLQLFQDRRQYRVPFYQRAYVWNKEDQWERLWSDIQDKAEGRLSNTGLVPHFMGAVVLEPQQRRGLLGVEALHIIDGQQRLTTLQYVLAALAIVLRSADQPALLSLVESCLHNSNAETMERPDIEVFKVWPTFRDRTQYKAALSAISLVELQERFRSSFTLAGNFRKIGIDHPPALEAIWYFHERMNEWVEEEEDLQQRLTRTVALSEAALRDLNIVSISLGEDDDAQTIFETLNGHGAQLNATDLIRNFIFMRADREKTAAGELYETLWSPFETSFWIDEQRRGRLKRPRLEWFMQTALQAELREDIEIGRLYAAYRRFAIGRARQLSASEQLRCLNEYSEHYRQLISGTGDTPIAQFGRQIAVWDASTTHPLALAIAMSKCSPEEQAKIFSDVVSYFVRRAICGLTTKNYNKVFIQQLKRLVDADVSHGLVRTALAALEGDGSRWPRDEEFRRAWLDGEAYPDRLDASRATWLLARLEGGLRSPRTEEPVPFSLDDLDVDHILPLSWPEHWPMPDGTQARTSEIHDAWLATFSDQPLSDRHLAVRRREIAKTKVGNLTLLHYGANRALQNQGFLRKRQMLFEVSNLHLNRELMRLDEWNEDSIERRGRGLFEVAHGLWPGPEQRTDTAPSR